MKTSGTVRVKETLESEGDDEIETWEFGWGRLKVVASKMRNLLYIARVLWVNGLGY